MAANDADGRHFAPRNTSPRVIVLSSGPRRDGNSRLLAEALVYATPIWWYGVSGMLKGVIGTFCLIQALFWFISDGFRSVERRRSSSHPIMNLGDRGLLQEPAIGIGMGRASTDIDRGFKDLRERRESSLDRAAYLVDINTFALLI